MMIRDLQLSNDGMEFVADWESVTFTDEPIVNLEWRKLNKLIAITESGKVWISRDKGKTWKIQRAKP